MCEWKINGITQEEEASSLLLPSEQKQLIGE